MDAGFFKFRRKTFSCIWIYIFTPENNFSRISSVAYKSDKIWSFSLHCLQPISLKFSSVNKRIKLFRIFFWAAVCFHGI